MIARKNYVIGAALALMLALGPAAQAAEDNNNKPIQFDRPLKDLQVEYCGYDGVINDADRLVANLYTRWQERNPSRCVVAIQGANVFHVPCPTNKEERRTPVR